MSLKAHIASTGMLLY